VLSINVYTRRSYVQRYYFMIGHRSL